MPDERVAIDGMSDCAANLGLAQQRVAPVEPQILKGRSRYSPDAGSRMRLEPAGVVRLHRVLDEVERALFELECPYHVVGHHAKPNLADSADFAMLGSGHQPNLVITVDLGDPVRPRADEHAV